MPVLQLETSHNPMAMVLYGITPNVTLDGVTRPMRWGLYSIELAEGWHELEISFPYMVTQKCCPGQARFHLGPGETKRLNYKAPMLMFQKGAITEGALAPHAPPPMPLPPPGMPVAPMLPPAQPGMAVAGPPGQPYAPAPLAHAPYGVHPVSGLPFSDKQKSVAGLLQLFLGVFGVGRFYTGHVGLAIAQIAVTWLTCGMGAVWPFIDGILLLTGDATDAQGRPLR